MTAEELFRRYHQWRGELFAVRHLIAIAGGAVWLALTYLLGTELWSLATGDTNELFNFGTYFTTWFALTTAIHRTILSPKQPGGNGGTMERVASTLVRRGASSIQPKAQEIAKKQ